MKAARVEEMAEEMAAAAKEVATAEAWEAVMVVAAMVVGLAGAKAAVEMVVARAVVERVVA